MSQYAEALEPLDLWTGSHAMATLALRRLCRSNEALESLDLKTGSHAMVTLALSAPHLESLGRQPLHTCLHPWRERHWRAAAATAAAAAAAAAAALAELAREHLHKVDILLRLAPMLWLH